MIPTGIAAQMEEIGRCRLSEAEIRAQYPDVVAWVNVNVSLVDLMRASGVTLRAISPDSPDVLVGDCPRCNGLLLVRR